MLCQYVRGVSGTRDLRVLDKTFGGYFVDPEVAYTHMSQLAVPSTGCDGKRGSRINVNFHLKPVPPTGC